jgi:hypothetical protein
MQSSPHDVSHQCESSATTPAQIFVYCRENRQRGRWQQLSRHVGTKSRRMRLYLALVARIDGEHPTPHDAIHQGRPPRHAAPSIDARCRVASLRIGTRVLGRLNLIIRATTRRRPGHP